MGNERAFRILTVIVAVAYLTVLQGCRSIECRCKQTQSTGPAGIFLKPNDPGMILVRGTCGVHYRVEKLLGSLRDAQPRSYHGDDGLWEELEGDTQRDIYPMLPERMPTEEDMQCMLQLETPTQVAFDHTPLEEVVARLQQTTETEFVLLSRDVPADGAPVTLHVNAQLQDILHHVCTLTGLAWDIRGGAAVIGARQSVWEFIVLVYPVRDLLIPFEQLRSGQPINTDPRDLRARAEQLVALIRSVCIEDQ